ncbi:MAG: alternative ribosome rescue aminoacyl-tRNA hydrolase ArfB [Myxococcales bacterium]|nr:alternative ribosome rescue aminoacyl-tRNA hydrolase ArfB [Myxococcales bacterium]MDH5566854.1 alternative ribosome rescue aminoacyl-tRNA hydrolase ArfB [Myxococcales bacterium]
MFRSMRAHDDLPIRPGLLIPSGELRETASRSGGPGGQHVNKTSTRVTLRWSVAESEALTPGQRQRLLQRLAGRLTRRGQLVVHAGRFRSRARNRVLARERLAELVRDALRARRLRIPTAPSRAAHERALRAKKRRAALKRGRQRVRGENDT